MSNNFSDHKKPQTSIFDLLPEVFRSDVNKSVSTTALDRHLTKDDTTRVTGFIGESNAQAVVDRRIKEETPHRQAFQLAPTMVSSSGVETNALSFKAFLTQLELMGVDSNRLPEWGNTLQFNWVPPVNIDMLINYQDYYWKPKNPVDQPQYMTVENNCNKARSRVVSYSNVLAQRGNTFVVKRIDHLNSVLVIDMQYDDLFVPGFILYTKDVVAVPPPVGNNVQNKFWTVVASTYDATTGETSIQVKATSDNAPLCASGPTNPVAGNFDGEWFYNTSQTRLYGWLYNSGTTAWEWTPITTQMALNISLSERLQVFQAQANCVCNQVIGWDINLWDDNPSLWDATLLANISQPTEIDWIAVNGAPVFEDPFNGSSIWYDTTNDELKQYNGTSWITVASSFSAVASQVTGTALWDLNTSCGVQNYNQWSISNQWVHKSELTSTTGAQRAKLPILEYDSTLELNEWVRATYAWKYRSNIDQVFTYVDISPKRIELEPIKGYYAEYFGGKWVLYLFHKDSTTCRDIDHSDTFVPGYRFRITDDLYNTNVYTVESTEYREITASYASTRTNPTQLSTSVGVDVMCTVVTLVDTTFVSPQIVDGHDAVHTRIEPVLTSMGDTWKGYHSQWMLDTNSLTYTPTTHQRWNYYRQISFDQTTALTPGSIPEFPVTFSAGVVGVAHQEYTIGNTSTTLVELHPTLRYNPTVPQMFAVPNSNEVRVYVNDVRQRGTYTENTDVGSPNYTLVGDMVYNTQQIEYVTGIVFNVPLNLFDVVRIEVGPAPFNCMGNNAVPVRTLEDETEFTLGLAGGTQPEYRSMTQCYHLDQTKTTLNQYPLFNVYDVSTSQVIAANQLFGYKEDSSYDINPYVQRRIVTSPSNKDFTFEQYLRSHTTEEIYSYRSVRTTRSYWYSPFLNQTLNWDGYAWTDRVVVNTSVGPAVRRIITSDIAPLPVELTLWMDTVSQILFQYTLVDSINDIWDWVEITDITINNSDPLLKSIWKHDLNNEHYNPDNTLGYDPNYTPTYVDSELNPVTPGDPNGDWGVVDQWMYNSEHKNYIEVSYAQLVTHLHSIITSQPKVPGLQVGGVYTLSQSEYNYGIGGTIKEHNDGFDTLISAVNVSNVTPIGVIEFAAQEYVSSILRTRDLFNRYLVDYLQTYTKDTFIDFAGGLSEQVITAYENNDYSAQLYGDTSAYDASTNIGLQNWIATIPMFGLGEKYQPHASTVGSTVYMFHHDGHRSTISYTAGEIDRFARQVCSTPDNRVTNGTLGVISASTPPTTKSAFTAAFGGSDPRTGVYWYQTSGTRKLYRFQAYDVTFTPPSFYDINGQELPDGIMYYDKGLNVIFHKTGLSWTQFAAVGDLSPLWMEVNVAELFASTLLEIEQQLYDVTPTVSPAFEYGTLSSEPEVFAYNKRVRFDDYVATRDITAPLVNTTYDISNAFTWNYVMSTFDHPVSTSPDTSSVGSWQALYTEVYGTPYPHLEPWVLQGFTNKPTWWDTEYLETDGSRRWKYNHATTTGMWEDIRIGRVPAGRAYPDGTMSTGDATADGQTLPHYAYFSVNIGDTSIGTYAPDALFPPYFTSATVSPIRSLFIDAADIASPSADYAFGEVGPVEWEWTVSAQYPYDLPIIAFLMQPTRLLHSVFGPQYTNIDGLQVDVLFKRVYSHEYALFHGDLYYDTEQYLVRGINQWYANFNRYTGYDTNTEFRELWANWNPTMTYQFGGIVDTSSFDIGSKYFDITEQDFKVVLVNNGVIEDTWIDAFEISLLSIPPAIVQYNNQALWKMEIDSLAAHNRSISYYGVRHYPTTVDTTTGTFTLNSTNIVGVNTSLSRFFVPGDLTYMFDVGTTFSVSNALSNDGTYTTTSTVYDTSANTTQITVSGTIPASTPTGIITVGMVIPWVTGDIVVMSSSKFLPAPLKPDTGYYIIRKTTNTFKLAETPQDAQANNAISITTTGNGSAFVSEVESSFNVFGGQGNTTELWFHYAINRNDVRTFTPPRTLTGMQNMVNLLDGYAAFQSDIGVANTGTDANDFDPVTGRLVDWALETERFIDWAFGLRQTRVRVNDRYDVSVDSTTNEFTFTNMTPYWLSGTPVVVGTTGSLPVPLIAGSVYYIVSTGTIGTFKLSLSANALDTAAQVDLLSQGSGQMYIALNDAQRQFPRFELNPYRNNIWINTPQGVLANVIEGPYTDIRVQQTIFDQYSRPMTPTQLTVYREDLRSHIATRPAMSNDVDQIYQDDPYNYIHVGGGHFFVEGYEHFLLYNDYTTDGALVYDQFLGLWAKRFTLDYFEKEDYTLRPTLGGYYLIDGQFERNMEGATDDMRVYYDVLGLSETSTVAPRARQLLGYNGRMTFLDLLNVNAKSQFMFYRGMIQAKGSVNSVKAYINSRRFVDAKIDEFWAWKIAEYGDAGRRVYPEVNVFVTDAIVDDVRLEFLAQSELESDPDVVDAVNKGFKIVSYSTPERWNNFPEQKAEIGSPLFLNAEASTLTVLYAAPTPPQATAYGHIDYWYDTIAHLLMVYNGTTWEPDALGHLVRQQVTIDGVDTDVLYLRHGDVCDEVRVIAKTVDAVPPSGPDYTPYDYTTQAFTPGTGTSQYVKVNSEVIRLRESDVVTVDSRPVIIHIYTLNPAKSKISPAKLIDKKAATVVQQVPIWHPALGYHSHVAIHNVDLQTSVDPARYNVTLNPATAVAHNWEENFWNSEEEGTVWLDTSTMKYLPYYDDKVLPNVNDRLYNWSKLAPWGSVKAYEWVESTNTPDMWTGDGIPRTQTFYRTRDEAVAATFDNVTDTVTVAGYTADVEVVFVVDNTGALPVGIDSSYKYVLRSTVSPNVYTIEDPLTETAVTFDDDGTAVFVIKSFNIEDWTENTLATDHITVPTLVDTLGGTWMDLSAPSLTTDRIEWAPIDMNMWLVNGMLPSTLVDVYVNGILIGTGLTIDVPLVPTPTTLNIPLPTPITLNEYDFVDVVRPIHVLTEDEINFNPDLDDDGTQLIQWKTDYYYSSTTKLINKDDSHSAASDTYYYFWVEQSGTRIAGDGRMPTAAIVSQLQNIPTPYLIVQRPKDDPILIDLYGYGVPQYDGAYSLGTLNESAYLVPVLYREAIVRGVSDYINDDDRYIIQFTCDHTLRDTVKSTLPMRKNKHQEWMLLRRQQTSTISRDLWDRLTESLIGYKLTDANVRVPSLDRVLYDDTYGTDTQYGLGIDQAFVNKELGMATVLAYLIDATHDFSPLDINAFFASYSFDAPEHIIEAMNAIYTSFRSEHVNGIWFEVLNDSLSLRAKYKELIKTSWVALHGIRVLEVGGLFDD